MANVARYCCCNVDCPAEISVTVSGVDAAWCCTDQGSNWRDTAAPSLDGTFTATLQSGISSYPLCEYKYTYSSVTVGQYDTGCVTPFSTESATPQLTVSLDMSATGSEVLQVVINAVTGTTFQQMNYYLHNADDTFDVALSNDYTVCQFASSSYRTTPGGTATVSL